MSDRAFFDFPEEAFPIVFRAFKVSDGEEVWAQTVQEPPVALYIPPLADKHGPVRLRVEFADGNVEEGRP